MKISDQYHIYFEENRLWKGINWLGLPMWKLPNDALILQEIIYQTKPEVIVETGTGHGGSALFYASILELLQNGGIVITIDKEEKVDFSNCEFEWADRIIHLIGESISQDIVKEVYEYVDSLNAMVILDSNHFSEYVWNELFLYSDLVSVGQYLVVEDTHVNNPVKWKHDDSGPANAVKEFLLNDDRFKVDPFRERLGMTFNPGGYLRRVK